MYAFVLKSMTKPETTVVLPNNDHSKKQIIRGVPRFSRNVSRKPFAEIFLHHLS